jgi:ankyrin repeat protein
MRQAMLWISCGLAAALLPGCGDTPLNRSIKQGDVAAVEKFSRNGGDVNKSGTNGYTALHTAILAGNKRIYSLLLSQKADPSKCDNDGASVIHLAAEQEDPFWVREALAHGGNPDQPNTGNRTFPDSTPIFYAIWKGRTATALELIDAGADVNHPNQHGTRPIAAAYGSHLFQVMHKLMDAGADPKLTRVLREGFWDEEGGDAVVKMVDNIKDEQERKWYAKVNQRLHDEGYLE